MALTLVTGPMFSGKSSHAILHCISHAQHGRSVVYITHKIDDRSYDSISSAHNGISASGLLSDAANFRELRLSDEDLLKFASDMLPDVVVVDEGQFFKTLVPACKQMMTRTRLLVCGLDFDFQLNPMGDIHKLPATERIHKTSFCMEKGCERVAHFTRRRKDDATPPRPPSVPLATFPEYLSPNGWGVDGPTPPRPPSPPLAAFPEYLSPNGWGVDDPIKVGGKESYEAVCAWHHPLL